MHIAHQVQYLARWLLTWLSTLASCWSMWSWVGVVVVVLQCEAVYLLKYHMSYCTTSAYMYEVLTDMYVHVTYMPEVIVRVLICPHGGNCQSVIFRHRDSKNTHEIKSE